MKAAQLKQQFIESYSRREEVSGTFSSPLGGEKIYYKRSFPSQGKANKELIHLVIIHGISEHHGRHQDLANFLLRKMPHEIGVTWIDLRGHGQSGGRRAYVSSFNEYCQDLTTLLDLSFGHLQSVNWTTKTKTILLGHNLGGLVCLKMLLQENSLSIPKIDGLILSSPLLSWSVCPKILSSFGDNLFRGPLKKIRVPRFWSGESLFSNAALSTSYEADHLVPKFITVNLVQEIIKCSSEVRGQAYFINLPCLFLLGEKDKFTDPQVTELFSRGVAKNLRKTHIYPSMHHDLMSDFDNEKVFRDVFKWLCQYVSK